jgi:hypothetical protein
MSERAAHDARRFMIATAKSLPLGRNDITGKSDTRETSG